MTKAGAQERVERAIEQEIAQAKKLQTKKRQAVKEQLTEVNKLNSQIKRNMESSAVSTNSETFRQAQWLDQNLSLASPVVSGDKEVADWSKHRQDYGLGKDK